MSKNTKQFTLMKKYIHTVFIVATIIATVFDFYAQELPPIEIFTTEDYGGGNQNWSVSQAVSKNIYVANNKGLLEYNGANWQLYPTPNETIMRSVKCIMIWYLQAFLEILVFGKKINMVF